MKKRPDTINIIINIIIIVTAIIAIYFLIQLLLSHSPPLSQVNSMFIVMIIGILFKFVHSFSYLNREVGEIKVGMKRSFSKIKEDMSSLKTDMDLIKKKLKV